MRLAASEWMEGGELVLRFIQHMVLFVLNETQYGVLYPSLSFMQCCYWGSSI